METIDLSLTLDNQSEFTDLGIEIWFDGQKLFDQQPMPGTTDFTTKLVCEDGEHTIKVCLSGKTAAHTVLDDSGSILSDAMIRIYDVCVDEIKVDQLLYRHAVYTHDTNGTTEQKQVKFFGNLGCNGTVELQIRTPFYYWLLDNM